MGRAVSLGDALPDRVTRIGAAHELRLSRAHEPVEVRPLVERVGAGNRPLDPARPRARRLASGVAVSGEGQSVELATPPLSMGPGVLEQVDDLLRSERTALRDLASGEDVTELTGSSSCLSISVPDEFVVGIGLTFVESCLFALSTVVSAATSPGLLVRPRRGRLEVCSEYVEGPDLVAGLTLLAACVGGLRDGSVPPRTGTPDVVPSQEIYGWYTPALSQLDAAQTLAEVWEWARAWADSQKLDPGPVDELVTGARRARGLDPEATHACTFGSPSGDDLPCLPVPRELRDGVCAEPEWLTWQHAVWLVRDPEGLECRAVVPLDQEEAFLVQLDAGRLDEPLARMLHRRAPRRRLTVNAQINDAVLWHEVQPAALVPAERRPDGRVPRVSRRQARRANLDEQQAFLDG